MDSEKPPYGEIYTVTNNLNGKIYVGQTTQGADIRWGSHRKTVRKKRGFSGALHKYGVENFTMRVVDTAGNQIELDTKEVWWIAHLNSLIPNGYNIEVGGRGGPKSQRTKELIGIANKGRRHSPEFRAKIRLTSTGRKPSLETRMKMSNAHKGVPKHLSPEGRQSAAEKRKLRVLTPESRAKMSAAQKARWSRGDVAPEFREKMYTHQNRGPQPKEIRDKISKSHMGKKHTAETLEKMKLNAKKGWHHTPEVLEKISTAGKGRKRSPEAIEKYRATRAKNKLKK